MSKQDDDILTEARQRFRLCHDHESKARTLFTQDLKFALASPDTPQWQWQQQHIETRARQQKPTLVCNKIRQHCLSIINEGRQSPPEMKIRAVGDGATTRSAEIYQSIIRHIMDKSNGQQAIDTASWYQVTCGIGYWRILTKYNNENTFDQDIVIQRIPNPLNVYLDPDITEFSGEDARFGFIFKDMPRDLFNTTYKKWADKVGRNTTFHDDMFSNWLSENEVRVAEYYTKTEKRDTLHLLENGQTVKRSEVKGQGANLMEELDAKTVNTRDVISDEIKWHLIAGDQILDEAVWPGKYIPIVRLVGEETNVDGVLDRYGHVRHSKDSQRIYNWMSSSMTESIGIQTKVPFTGANEAVEEYMDQWSTANTVNHSILTYRAYNDAGQKLDPPSRIEPPTMPQAYIEAMKIATDELNSVTGQYEASFGAPSNERSGKAIDARNRIAGTSSYHYVAHLSEAIRFSGKIILDLIPKVYDVQKVLKIVDPSGRISSVMLDPNHPQAHTDMQPGQAPPNTDLDDLDLNDIVSIWNPAVGEFSVTCDIGPSYATKRLELFNSLTDILSQNESLTSIVGDLLFRSADFELADEVADRLKRMVPPQALGVVDPQVQALQQQLQAQTQLLGQMSQKLHDSESKHVNTAMQKDIDWYNAETKRMEVASKLDPEAMRPIIRQLVSEVMGMPVNHLIAAHAIEGSQITQMTQPQDPTQPQQPQSNGQMPPYPPGLQQ